MTATRRSRLWPLLLLLGICALLGLTWAGFMRSNGHGGPVAPATRAQLLSNPTVRDWMHALSEEEREVASLQRQQLRQPGIPLPQGEALDQEQAQLLRTWSGLYQEWLVDGGQPQECPEYERYHGCLATPAH